MNNYDKRLVKNLYSLTDGQCFEADKISRRLKISILAAAKILSNRIHQNLTQVDKNGEVI